MEYIVKTTLCPIQGGHTHCDEIGLPVSATGGVVPAAQRLFGREVIMPNQESILQVQDVHFRYDPEQPKYAVDGVTLDIRRGEFVAVLGANGCGKSTLAKHFNAILLPEAGTVLVEGWTPATKIPLRCTSEGRHGVPEPRQPDRSDHR